MPVARWDSRIAENSSELMGFAQWEPGTCWSSLPLGEVVNQGPLRSRCFTWLWKSQPLLPLLSECKVQLLSTNVSCKGPAKYAHIILPMREEVPSFSSTKKREALEPLSPPTHSTARVTQGTDIQGQSHWALTYQVL